MRIISKFPRLTFTNQSTNDVLALEIEAAGTEFEAGTTSKDAFASLIDGDQWMIYRNVETGVLHWDFVSLSFLSINFNCILI